MHDVIRRADVHDGDAVAALNGELGYPSTAAQMADRLARVRAQGDEVFVAEAEGAPVGWIHVAALCAMESGDFAEIRGLVVTAGRRGGGIGARLLRVAEEWAAGRGVNRLRVRTNVLRERAHAFYERQGFTHRKMQRVYEKSL